MTQKRWHPRLWKTASLALVLSLGMSVLVSIFDLGIFIQDIAQTWPLIGGPISRLSEPLAAILFDRFVILTAIPALFIPIYGLLRLSRPQTMIARLWPDAPFFLNSNFEREGAEHFDAFAPDQLFLDRDNDIQILMDFAHNKSHRQSWTQLTGRMGYGKTRLALEWLKALAADKDTKWDVGFLGQVSLDDMQNARIRRATAIVVDDAATDPLSLWPKIIWLLRQNINREFPIRILLVDQYPADETRDGLVEKDDLLRTQKKVMLKSLSEQPTYRLTRMDEPSAQILGAQAKMSAPNIRKAEGRPLLLRLGDNPGFEMARRAEQRLAIARSEEERFALALAALAGDIDNAALPKRIRKVGPRRRLALFEGAGWSKRHSHLPGLRPRFLAGALLLQWIDQASNTELDALIEAAMSANALQTRRAIEDVFADQAQLSNTETAAPRHADAMDRLKDRRPPDWAEAALADIRVLATQQHDLGLAGDIPAMLDVHDALRRRADAWGDESGIRTAYAASIACCVSHFNATEHSDALAAALAELKRLSDAPTATADIILQYAMGLVNASDDFGQAADLPDRWDRVSTCVAELKRLSDAPTATSDIILPYAKGLVNASSHYGEALDLPDRWNRVSACVVELKRLSDAPTATSDIILPYAKGLVNASSHYGEALDLPDRWNRVSACVVELKRLSDAPTATSDITLQYAMGLANASDDFGQAADLPDRWDRLSACVAELKRLSDAPTATSDITLQYAMGLVNASDDFGQAADLPDRWDRVSTCVAELKRLSDAPTATSDITLRYAMGLVNASHHYGQAADLPDRWDRVSACIAALQRLSDAPTATSDIRHQYAKGLVNASSHYGEAADRPDRWDRVSACVAELKRLSDAPTATSDTILNYAKGLFNASIDFPQSSDGSADAFRQIARLSRRHPMDGALQGFFSECIPQMSYIEQQGAGWPYGRPEDDPLPGPE
ncbi:MAG: hypothetical protein ACSHX3_09395 [Litorimonas sp.]